MTSLFGGLTSLIKKNFLQVKQYQQETSSSVSKEVKMLMLFSNRYLIWYQNYINLKPYLIK